MSDLRLKLLGLLTLVFLVPTQLLAAEEGAGGGVLVADTRKLHGLELLWGNIYNDGHVPFAVFTVVLIPTCGVILGLLADQFMRRLGIDLKKRALTEH
jgi:hypothetical protein